MMISRWSPIRRVVQSTRIRTFSPSDEPTGFSRWLFSLKKSPPGSFDPVNHPYDLVPTILICQKLEFDLTGIEEQINGLYDPSIMHRHKHNLILSLEDGLLSYYDHNQMDIPYARVGNVDLNHRFTWPGKDAYVHFKLFASYMFMLTASKTLLYPEFSEYIGTIEGGNRRDQV